MLEWKTMDNHPVDQWVLVKMKDSKIVHSAIFVSKINDWICEIPTNSMECWATFNYPV